MKSARSAAFLHSAAAALERVARRLEPRAPSMADECEALRRELEAEAAAEFGCRLPESETEAALAARHRVPTPRGSEPMCGPYFAPDPASPGDVWPQKVTPFVRKLRGVR